MLLISLKKNELLYDIEYMSYKVAKVHFLDGQPQSVADVAVARDDHDFIDRLLHSAFANVKEKIQWCVDRRPHRVATDMLRPGRHDYDLVLDVNDKRREMADSICSAVHDYVVHHVLHRFLAMTAPEFSDMFADMAENDIERVYNLCRTNTKYRFYSWI